MARSRGEIRERMAPIDRLTLLEDDVDGIEDDVRSIRLALWGAATSFVIFAATVAATVLTR